MEKSKIVYVILTGSGGALLGLLCLGEILLAWPVVWWVYGIVTAVFGGAMVAAVVGGGRRWQRAAPVVGIVMAWVVFLVPWSTRKPFLRDLRSIEAGMSAAEVRRIMDGYMEGTGWPTPGQGEAVAGGTPAIAGSELRYATVENSGELEIEGALVFRHSNEGAYNSDWGIVAFEGGRVSGVEFSAD